MRSPLSVRPILLRDSGTARACCALKVAEIGQCSSNIELHREGRKWDTLTDERADHSELRVEVARFVGELLKDHAAQIWTDEAWRIDVTDQDGLIFYVMHLVVTNGAASIPMPRPEPE